MGSRASQRTVYLVTAAIVASMVAGFGLAELQLGQTNNSYQGSQTTTVTPLPGLTWLSTNLSEVPNALVFSTCGATAATACNVGTASATLCVGSFNASLCKPSDFVEQVTLTTVVGTAFYGTTYPVTVTLATFVTGTPVGGVQGTYSGSTFYFTETASPATAESIVLDFDIGATPTGPGGVTSVSVIATT